MRRGPRSCEPGRPLSCAHRGGSTNERKAHAQRPWNSTHSRARPSGPGAWLVTSMNEYLIQADRHIAQLKLYIAHQRTLVECEIQQRRIQRWQWDCCMPTRQACGRSKRTRTRTLSGRKPWSRPTRKNHIMIYGPSRMGTYVVEFSTSAGDLLANPDDGPACDPVLSRADDTNIDRSGGKAAECMRTFIARHMRFQCPSPTLGQSNGC
jgi:hypothetical protein